MFVPIFDIMILFDIIALFDIMILIIE